MWSGSKMLVFNDYTILPLWIQTTIRGTDRKDDQSTLLRQGESKLCEIHLFLKIRKMKREFSSVQFSHVWLFATPWTTARQASLSITDSQSLLKLMSIELVTPSNHLILCCSLLLPSIFPSIRVFSNESVSSLHQMAKVLYLQHQHQFFQWIFRVDFL